MWARLDLIDRINTNILSLLLMMSLIVCLGIMGAGIYMNVIASPTLKEPCR